MRPGGRVLARKARGLRPRKAWPVQESRLFGGMSHALWGFEPCLPADLGVPVGVWSGLGRAWCGREPPGSDHVSSGGSCLLLGTGTAPGGVLRALRGFRIMERSRGVGGRHPSSGQGGISAPVLGFLESRLARTDSCEGKWLIVRRMGPAKERKLRCARARQGKGDSGWDREGERERERTKEERGFPQGR